MLFNLFNPKESHWFRGLKAAEEEHKTTGSLQCVYYMLREAEGDCCDDMHFIAGMRDYVKHQLERVPAPKRPSTGYLRFLEFGSLDLPRRP